MQKRSFYSYASLGLLAILFASLSVLSGRLLRGVRIDLTENHLYTLSQGTRHILAGLKEPVNLYLFFSQKASRDLPQLRSYDKRVEELLDELAASSNGKLKIHFIDPQPFSEQEDQAARYGLQAVPVGTGGTTTLYFGIAGSNSLDDVQTMPFLQPSKEKFLEYDLAKMISSLGNPKHKTIGLISSLPMQGGYDPASQRMRQEWVVYQQLSQLFNIKKIDPKAGTLPSGLDLLVLVHPRNLDAKMLYQIDQFVLRGGHLLAFIDPLAEADRGDPTNPMGRMEAGSSSQLGPLLDSWGVKFNPLKILGDLQYGIGNGNKKHIGIISVPTEGMNGNDVVTADLGVVNFSSTGWFQIKKGASTHVETLVSSSENAAPIDSSRMRFLANPADLLTGFNPTGDRYALAVRISGKASSAYAKPPEGVSASGHLAQSVPGGINVILFADTDILTDRLWVQRQPFLGQTVLNAFADNGNIVVNAVDNLLGNRDLISIRTRASSVRPFERVNELQVQAERKYRATQERLQQELKETEQKLTELQSARKGDNLQVLTDAQQTEIKRFLDRKLEIRRELRQVEHDLQENIDSLGTRLKLINIALVPLLVIVVAVIYSLRRRRRFSRQLVQERTKP